MPLGNAQRLVDNRWAFLKGYGKATGKCPNIRCPPIGREAELPIGYWQKHGNFHPFSLKHRISVLKFLKVEGAMEHYINAEGLFSYLCSFQPFYFLPNSNWCDSPFKSLSIFNPFLVDIWRNRQI
jgi:hypothetical protein